jgi:Arc/MetJ family transcription regulator
LADAYKVRIIVCLRTTINIGDELLANARKYTGEEEKTKLVHLGLESLVQKHVAKRLIALGGTDPKAKAAPRRRAWKKK